MTFSLMSVCNRNLDGTVDGYWIQDSVGSVEDARALAKRTSEANSNLEIEVVEQLLHPTPRLEYWSNRITV